jgi:ADP-heptose:LPS heptosyltransferase
MIKKILILRFSSIGDIVLTTPVVRCLKNQLGAEIHYLTKAPFKTILSENPHIDKLITFEKSADEVLDILKNEKYDYVVDLHNNIRTLKLKGKLGVKSAAFPKLNMRKWLFVNTKWDVMPDIHVVDRYFKAVESLGVQSDGLGLDYYIPESDQVDLYEILPTSFQSRYWVYTLGAQYKTKCLPEEKINELLVLIDVPIVFLGGKEDANLGERLAEKFPLKSINLAGKLNLNQSASVVQQSSGVVCHDTGLMHIASAFQKKMAVIWGNTTPKIGMYPYLPKSEVEYFEVKELHCRPCSKIGFQKCPKGHFKCMNNQDLEAIADFVNQMI